MFSVALNIGFVIMAITMIHHHSKSFHERSWLDIVGIVHRLELPATKEGAVLDTITKFRVTAEKNDQDLKIAHRNIILLLARTGPLDRDQLHQLIETADHQEKRKNEAFESHVFELRNQLGNEKGPLFFSFLLKHLNDKDQLPNR
jgi:hypothetical protein